MTYVQFTILVPEGPDFREIHYNLKSALGFQPGTEENTLVRAKDAAHVSWKPVEEVPRDLQ